ncbi:MAG TPA: MoxR family ATPase [Planctomycetota bacterium]|nr:MoxR family ATPase [Planctomycetota bacterium]
MSEPEKPQQMSDAEAVEKLAKAHDILLKQIHKVIIGQNSVIDEMLISMFCRGHCLVVGVPGLAKTLLVRTMSRVLHLKFNRIQFTPDLMPSDITGTHVIEQDMTTGKREFRFVRGPIFANILLADEINRTPPKTQAALLQAMQEYQVSAGDETHELELPFFVLATQNPIEQEGTYPLPEAQLDRFMLNILIDYPDRDDEREIVKSTTYDIEAELKPVLKGSDILYIQKIVRRVPVSDHVVDYAVNLARATRPGRPESPDFINNWLSWGAGPRAAQHLVLAAKARTILSGRFNVSAEDIRSVAHPVFRHRLFTNFNADAEGVTPEHIIDKLLETIPEPSEQDYARKPASS